MKLLTAVIFEREEIAVFRLAFNPIARLADYPDLIANLAANDHVDYDKARRIANTLGREAERTDKLDLDYVNQAHSVLLALQAALAADLAADYSPTPAKAVAVLLEARQEQLANIKPALNLLAWAHASAL